MTDSVSATPLSIVVSGSGLSLLGCHSSAFFCASAICCDVIFSATDSRSLNASIFSPGCRQVEPHMSQNKILRHSQSLQIKPAQFTHGTTVSSFSRHRPVLQRFCNLPGFPRFLAAFVIRTYMQWNSECKHRRNCHGEYSPICHQLKNCSPATSRTWTDRIGNARCSIPLNVCCSNLLLRQDANFGFLEPDLHNCDLEITLPKWLPEAFRVRHLQCLSETV